MIKNVIKLFKDDLKATMKNPVVLIVITALIVLPSLYSVLNIDACWDPYNNTDQMDFIIVNNDNPVTVNGTTYNYGQKVVDALDDDNNFNWVYMDEDDARDSIQNGSYYSAIVIPSDFTEKILSINTAQPQQAQLEYINNEKLSPVAMKITENAADKVNTKINDEVVQSLYTKNYASSANQQALAQQTATQNASTSNGTTTSVSQQSTMQAAQNYFYSPVTMSKYSYYDSDTFGDAITPFYTTLSIWVGCIILVALLSMQPVKGEEKDYTPTERYFGKMGLFMIMGTLQSCVTFTGLCMLGVTMNNPLLFLISIIMTSLSCMVIVYSLVSLFGNVGKALSIIILVFQISGTSGIYPVQVVSTLFKDAFPYLPLTYGMGILRESLSGVILNNYLISLGGLLIFPIAAIIISVIIKEKLDKKSRYFEDELRKSNLFYMK